MSTLSNKVVNDFLRHNNLAVAATVSSETGAPQASMIYYIADDKRHIYFLIAADSRKLMNIRKHTGVALVVSDDLLPIELQLEATAREVTDGGQKDEIINKLTLVSNDNPKTKGWPPLLTLSMKSGIVCLEITIDRFKYSDFTVHPGIILAGTGRDLLFNYA